MSVGRKIWFAFNILLFPLLAAGVGATAYSNLLFQKTIRGLPAPDALFDYTPRGITEIYATDKDPKTGKLVILGRVFSRYQEYETFDKIPVVMKNATVSVEDERFYQHVGVDVRGIGRAVFRDVRDRRMGEGGSTLTQQLVRNIFPSVGNQKTFTRKLQEMMLAIQLEKNFSKDEILQRYLNEVCYGANTYGVKAAAKMYFGKPVQKLTIGEAALLAGLPQRPADYELFDHLDNALERRKTVLAKMVQLGYITQKDSDVAQKQKIKVLPRVDHKQTSFTAPYFTNYVLRQLIATYGKEGVYQNGLKVYTTLNSQMQKQAEAALINGVLGARGDKGTEGALVCLEPHQGYIRAMVGGIDYKKNEFNNVTQGRRQPGSSFKPFVYTAAFETRKFGPDSSVNDAPTRFGKKAPYYRPQNYGGGYHGWTTIRQALAHSYNVPAVAVADQIGIAKVIDTAQKMGIKSKLQNTKAGDLSLALGSYDVSPLEIASAYGVFPNHGSHASPMAIIRVVDSEGKVLENHAPQIQKAVVPETVTRDVSDMLKGVVDFGTAAGAQGIHEVGDAHGKTGTTSDNKDAWFVGYTPELVTAVWVCGVKRNAKTGKVQYLSMDGVTGGHVCAPIWARFMKAAVPIQQTSGLNIPAAPEKSVPGTLSAASLNRGADDGNDGENRPRRRRRRRSTNTDNGDRQNEAAKPSPSPTAESGKSDSSGDGEPAKSGDKPGDTAPSSEGGGSPKENEGGGERSETPAPDKPGKSEKSVPDKVPDASPGE